MKRFLTILMIAGLFVTLSCGGGTGTTTDDTTGGSGSGSAGSGGGGTEDATPSSNLTDGQEENALLMMQATLSSLSLIMKQNANPIEVKDVASTDSITCDSGTVSVTTNLLLFSNCTISVDEDETVFINGSITVSELGGTMTVRYDIVFTFTFDGDSTTFAMGGSVSADDDTITFNELTGTFEDTTYTMSGSITEATDDMFDGNITVSVGDYSATCVFNSFDPDEATAEEFAESCGF